MLCFSTLVANGTCIEYTGSCDVHFDNRTGYVNKTFVPPKRYVDPFYGINKTDRIFQEFIKKSDQIGIQNKECAKAVPSSLCKYAFPLCNNDGSPQKLCREDCEYMYKLCKEEMNSLLTLIQFMLVERNIDFSHLRIPNCGSLQYSWDIDPSLNISCGYLFDLGKPLCL